MYSLSKQLTIHHDFTGRFLDSFANLFHAVTQSGVRGQKAGAFHCLLDTENTVLSFHNNSVLNLSCKLNLNSNVYQNYSKYTIIKKKKRKEMLANVRLG